jgi:hypothetical protein
MLTGKASHSEYARRDALHLPLVRRARAVDCDWIARYHVRSGNWSVHGDGDLPVSRAIVGLWNRVNPCGSHRLRRCINHGRRSAGRRSGAGRCGHGVGHRRRATGRTGRCGCVVGDRWSFRLAPEQPIHTTTFGNLGGRLAHDHAHGCCQTPCPPMHRFAPVASSRRVG